MCWFTVETRDERRVWRFSDFRSTETREEISRKVDFSCFLCIRLIKDRKNINYELIDQIIFAEIIGIRIKCGLHKVDQNISDRVLT